MHSDVRDLRLVNIVIKHFSFC